MYDRRVQGEIGRGEPFTAAAAAAAAADPFSARPDLFPPIGAIEFYRYFNVTNPNTLLYAAGSVIVTPNRLRLQIPTGFRFRISKFSCLRTPGFSHDQTQAGYPDAEAAIATGNLDPTELLLDGAPVSGTRLLFDSGGVSVNGAPHDVYVRGRGPVEISVRISKNPLSVSWGSNGAWYRGWMWIDRS